MRRAFGGEDETWPSDVRKIVLIHLQRGITEIESPATNLGQDCRAGVGEHFMDVARQRIPRLNAQGFAHHNLRHSERTVARGPQHPLPQPASPSVGVGIYCEQSRLQQDERFHLVREMPRQPQGYEPASARADDHGGPCVECGEEGRGVVDVLDKVQGGRRRDECAAVETAAVENDAPPVITQRHSGSGPQSCRTRRAM